MIHVPLSLGWSLWSCCLCWCKIAVVFRSRFFLFEPTVVSPVSCLFGLMPAVYPGQLSHKEGRVKTAEQNGTDEWSESSSKTISQQALERGDSEKSKLLATSRRKTGARENIPHSRLRLQWQQSEENLDSSFFRYFHKLTQHNPLLQYLRILRPTPSSLFCVT